MRLLVVKDDEGEKFKVPFLIGILLSYFISISALAVFCGVAHRAYSFSAMALFLFIILTLKDIVPAISIRGVLSCSVMALTILFFLCEVALFSLSNYKYDINYSIREKTVLDGIAEGKSELVVPVIKQRNSVKYICSYGLGDITPDATYWANSGFAYYYGLKSVVSDEALQ